MLDIKTLMFCLFIVEVLLTVLMIVSGRIQKNNPGFDVWSVSLVVLATASVLLMLRGVIPDIFSIIGGNLLFILSLLLMAESLYRFFTSAPLMRWYYLIIFPVGLLITYFTVISDNIAVRNLIFSGSSILIILGIVWMIRRESPEHDLPSRFIIGIFLLFILSMGIRAVCWMIYPAGMGLFEANFVNIGIYLAGIISLIVITFFYRVLNYQRLEGELRDSHATTEKVLADLHERNRDLEQVSTSLWKVTNELDQKVRDRTRKIESLLLQKDQFINQIAHDLRTPLTPLVAIIPLVKEEISDPDLLALLEILDKNVKNMRDMTEQIVRLANLNSQSSITDYHEIRVSDLIHDAIRLNEALILDRDISIDIDVPPHLLVCVSKIFGMSIFSNILNNAAKYNSPSGRIDITATEGETTISISIADTGIGIRADTMDKIWDELYICDNSRTDPLSKGLGLSMVRRIVNLHGGEITASSPGIGGGSVFIIRLPKICPAECLVSSG